MMLSGRLRAWRPAAAALVLAFSILPESPQAKEVPQNLASMAKDLLTQSRAELNETTGNPEQDSIRRRARQILKEAGVRHWASTEVDQKGGVTAVAEALEMDLSDPDQWAWLHSVLARSDRDGQIARLRDWAKVSGMPYEGAEFDRLLAKFDEGRAKAAGGLARSYAREVSDNEDRLELEWNPARNSFEIRIKAKATSEPADDGFELRLTGDVTSTPAVDGDDITLSVEASDSGVIVLTDRELRQLAPNMFGNWRDAGGDVWEISSSGGDTRSTGPAISPEDQIAELEQEIRRIGADNIFRWENLETGEIVVQDRFKRLKEPYKFRGEERRRPGAEVEIARLEDQIQTLREANKRLPVDAEDPIGMGEVPIRGQTQSLTIQVTDEDGFSWTYDKSLFSGGRITAKRTLRDIRDITSLPKIVIRQLITSWSPPEWIELEVAVESRTGQMYLSGRRWRLHATYDGEYYDVSRIHTPYARDLRLDRAETNVAQGAAADKAP